MAVFQVETPTGIIEVEAPNNATDQELIERAKVIYGNPNGPVAPKDADLAAPDKQDQTNMNQARAVGGIVGGLSASTAVGFPTALGAAKSLVTGGAPLPGGISGVLGKVASRAVGPYGAITSAQDATQRYNTAKSPMDYVQSGISGLGALGYGAGMVPTPMTKIGGPIVGGMADAMNYGIDRMRQPTNRPQAPNQQIVDQMQQVAAQRAMNSGAPVAPGPGAINPATGAPWTEQELNALRAQQPR